MPGPVHGCILGTLLLAGAAQGGDSVPTGTMDLGSDQARQPVLLFHTGRHHSNGGGVHLTTPGQHIPSTTTSDTSDKGPVDLDPANFIIPPDQDPFSFLSDAVNFVRTDIGKPLNFSFEPQLIYIFQHATKSNGPHSFSYIYTNINGSLPFDDPDDARDTWSTTSRPTPVSERRPIRIRTWPSDHRTSPTTSSPPDGLD